MKFDQPELHKRALEAWPKAVAFAPGICSGASRTSPPASETFKLNSLPLAMSFREAKATWQLKCRSVVGQSWSVRSSFAKTEEDATTNSPTFTVRGTRRFQDGPQAGGLRLLAQQLRVLRNGLKDPRAASEDSAAALGCMATLGQASCREVPSRMPSGPRHELCKTLVARRGAEVEAPHFAPAVPLEI